MIFYSFAKINLALDILGKDKNGYHMVQTVLQTLPLFDEVMVEREKGDGKFSVSFRGNEAEQIDPNDNTVIKAIQTINAKHSFKHDYNIVIYKNIPIGAGLGGGSSNAASVINALNKLEEIGMTNDELREISAPIGVDVPFFIEGETAVGTHYGERIKSLPSFKDFLIWKDLNKILVIPDERKNTKNKYEEIDINLTGKNAAQTDELLKGLLAASPKDVLANLHNDFEITAGPKFQETKDILMKNGAQHVMLCGAGTALFAASSNQFDLEVLSPALPHQRILDLIR